MRAYLCEDRIHLIHLVFSSLCQGTCWFLILFLYHSDVYVFCKRSNDGVPTISPALSLCFCVVTYHCHVPSSLCFFVLEGN